MPYYYIQLGVGSLRSVSILLRAARFLRLAVDRSARAVAAEKAAERLAHADLVLSAPTFIGLGSGLRPRSRVRKGCGVVLGTRGVTGLHRNSADVFSALDLHVSVNCTERSARCRDKLTRAKRVKWSDAVSYNTN